ncbi:E3 ubiquitin/ISG15 ligase TRIM25-like [Hyla sarda]|uniref:E3 ubiquitin/ISG15 ligase TRIM25-like n=1 Tax=Hyla sarda TaxID=327740 RepID=UPI0024C39B67|nr:E3 ubiquitin/ISG15 ligase TRIM25-like [Hyla sarda]
MDCTFCDSPVVAVKTCLLCEAFMCKDHLEVHSRSSSHVLSDPTTSLKKEKCSVHNEIFRYFCSEDGVCLCVSCCMDSAHRDHQLEPLLVAYEKLKDSLKSILEKWTRNEIDADLELKNLQKEKMRIQEKKEGVMRNVASLFQDVHRRLEALEKQVLGEVFQQVKMISQMVSQRIQQVEKKKTELSEKISQLETLSKTADVVTLLQQGGSWCAGGLPDMEDIGGTIKQRYGELQAPSDLDEGLISVTLYHGLSDIIASAKGMLYVREASDLSFNVNTAGEHLDITGTQKTLRTSYKKINRPKLSERFQYSQVLSTRSFSSGRHYWEVETGQCGNWRVGVCYPSMDRRGDQSYIGHNRKSWCIGGCNRLYTVMHNERTTHLPQKSAASKKLGLYLDYEAGQLSFYELGDTIKNLYTFMATFTEPLHAAFGVWNSHITIRS